MARRRPLLRLCGRPSKLRSVPAIAMIGGRTKTKLRTYIGSDEANTGLMMILLSILTLKVQLWGFSR